MLTVNDTEYDTKDINNRVLLSLIIFIHGLWWLLCRQLLLHVCDLTPHTTFLKHGFLKEGNLGTNLEQQ